jgi:hypothetical protein
VKQKNTNNNFKKAKHNTITLYLYLQYIMNDFKRKLSKQYSDDIECLSSTYIDAKTNMNFRCKTCNHEFEQKRCNLIGTRAYKYPCPKCRQDYRDSLKYMNNIK